jgi:hypothetical protein
VGFWKCDEFVAMWLWNHIPIYRIKLISLKQVRGGAMRSSGITLIAEERAAHRRARVRALELIVAAAISLGAIYAIGEAFRLNLENDAKAHQLVQR